MRPRRRPAPASPHRRPASTPSTSTPPWTVSPPGVIHRRERAGRWVVPWHRAASSHAGARSAGAPDGWGTAPLRWVRVTGMHVRRFASHRRRARGQRRAVVEPTVRPTAEVTRSPPAVHHAALRSARWLGLGRRSGPPAPPAVHAAPSAAAAPAPAPGPRGGGAELRHLVLLARAVAAADVGDGAGRVGGRVGRRGFGDCRVRTDGFGDSRRRRRRPRGFVGRRV